MMLSRAAQRVYWLGRYLERAEDTARIVQQYTQLLLDLPASSGVDWTELPRIFGVTQSVEPKPGQRTEHAVVEQLLSRADSPAMPPRPARIASRCCPSASAVASRSTARSRAR